MDIFTLALYIMFVTGSEGKLAVAGQRAGLMTAIGNLSNSGVTASSQQTLAVVAVEAFIPVLQQEGMSGVR